MYVVRLPHHKLELRKMVQSDRSDKDTSFISPLLRVLVDDGMALSDSFKNRPDTCVGLIYYAYSICECLP